MQLGFYFDQTRCSGCFTCVVACKDWNNVPAGPACWRRVSTLEEGEYPNFFVSFFTDACYHCAEPSCVSVCPAGAIAKREQDGIVMVDRGKCQEAGRCGIISGQAMGAGFSYGTGESPCQLACPAHVSVPGYIALIANGRFKDALDLVRQSMPLPSVCGRVCLAPCEKECRRRDVDQPVAIDALKRFVSDHVTEALPPPVPQTKQGKVAIIGSGPSGLSAAYDLIRKGYRVAIYEASPVAGGMLATGIPSYRLPQEVLERDLNYIKALGVQIKTNTQIGSSPGLDDLRNQGYGAILLAVGAQESTMPNIPGANLRGTLLATSFLRDSKLGKKVEIGEKVMVIGGGNVAIDCARTARRLGASVVRVACLECRKDMPAVGSEIEEAEKEGIIVHPSITVTRISGRTNVSRIECLNLRKVEFDEQGQPHMDIIEGSEHTFPADTVIFATGQKPVLSYFDGWEGIARSKRGTLVADPETLAISQEGVFACGDVVNGSTSVVEAIASGQKAAFYIDRYMQGYVLKTHLADRVRPSDVKVEVPAGVEKLERQPMPFLSASARVLDFREVAMGYDQEMAVAEAKRCLNCAGHLCKDVCPYHVPQFGAEEKPKMQKCDLCLERWVEDKKPICVDSCPMRALDAGPLDELKKKYGDITKATGFEYSTEIKPSILFKPRLIEKSEN